MIESNVDLKIPAHVTQLAWALELKKMSMAIIPTYPQSKVPAIKWKHSSGFLTEDEILRHWGLHPDHESAILPGENLVVLDADSNAAIMALTSLEYEHGMKPSIIVGTRRGEHHYFRLDEDVKAFADAHSTDVHPERIDVLTDRRPVMGPGSSNKRVVTWDATSFAELSPASQAFLDAIRAHNGHKERVPRSYGADSHAERAPYGIDVLGDLLEFIDLDDREDWIRAGMVLYRETSGSAEGLALYDTWSSKSSKYPGTQSIEETWHSFENEHSNPVSMGTLIHLARQGGADTSKILGTAPNRASKADDEVDQTPGRSIISPFDRHNAVPVIADLEKEVLDERIVFGGLVAMGEATVIYADANTGKTLIMLSEIIQSIRKNLVKAEDVIYVNLDDPLRGFAQKTRIAQEFNFLMLGEGCQNFRAKDVVPLMKESVLTRTAKGKILIIDTATKVVNLMKKDDVRDFGEVCRDFTRANGTVVILAHTNKNRNSNGGSVYSGVADIKHNFDCIYIMDKVTDDEKNLLKTVKFSYEKMRASVKSFATYRYSINPALSYVDRLLSVELVDPESSGVVEDRSEDKPESACVDAIERSIERGINTKMNLMLEARSITGSSKGKVEKVLKKFTGTTVGVHRWTFEKAGKNNAYIFRLLTNERDGHSAAPPVSGFSGSPVSQPAASPVPAANQHQTATYFDDEENEELEDVTF